MNLMRLMHHLADIRRQQLLHSKKYLLSSDDQSGWTSAHHAPLQLPRSRDSFLVSIRFAVDQECRGTLGLQWGVVADEGLRITNRFTLDLQRLNWQVARVEEPRGLRLFEQRGRLEGGLGSTLDMAILCLHGRLHIYLRNMQVPVLQVPLAELPLAQGDIGVFFQDAEMPVMAELKLWMLDAAPSFTMSIEELLRA